jgi:hypothetical protein
MNIPEIVCTRSAVKEYNSLGGYESSNVELITSYIKYRYNHYDHSIIAFNNVSYLEHLIAVPSEFVSKDTAYIDVIIDGIRKHCVVDTENYARVEGDIIYLTSEPTDYEIITSINLANSTHNLHNVWENIIENGEEVFPCGNYLELCSDEVVSNFIESIDFKFTTVQNVLSLMNLIFIDRDKSNLSDNLVIGLNINDDGLIMVYNKSEKSFEMYPGDIFEQKYSYGDFS